MNDAALQTRPGPWSTLWSFGTRDYVFAAVTAAAIHVVGFATISLVAHIPIPGIRSVVSAPFSAFLLTIGLARIGRPLAMLLVMLLASVVYLLISPVIPMFVMTSVVLTEALNLALFRGYATQRSRMTCVSLFYTAMTPVAALFGAFILGGQYARMLSSWTVLAGSTALVFALSLGACWLGEKVVRELKRAGKL